MTSEQAETAGPAARTAVLCAIVYILLIHPLITQHHISCYKIRIIWNYYIYLVSADKVNRCVVFGCSNTPSERVSLHKFSSDKHRRQIWARFVRGTHASWNLEESVFICSKHFCDDDFVNKLKFDMGYAKGLVLKETAIPTIYPTVTTAPVVEKRLPHSPKTTLVNLLVHQFSCHHIQAAYISLYLSLMVYSILIKC